MVREPRPIKVRTRQKFLSLPNFLKKKVISEVPKPKAKASSSRNKGGVNKHIPKKGKQVALSNPKLWKHRKSSKDAFREDEPSLAIPIEVDLLSKVNVETTEFARRIGAFEATRNPNQDQSGSVHASPIVNDLAKTSLSLYWS